MNTKKNTAVLLTGAAARISQEVAIIDALIDREKLNISVDDTYLAGFSSGSLNLLAINSCFSPGAKLDWNADYKEGILFSLKTNQVFEKDGSLPFNTEPLRITLNKFLESAGFECLGDYPFYSNVLVFSDRKLKTLWPCSENAKEKTVLLSDLHMSSTAIPFVFPWQEIHSKTGDSDLPNGHFQDGGTGGTFKHFEDHIGEFVKEQGSFKDLYIISPMRYAETLEHKEFEKELETHFSSKVKLNGVKEFLGEISQKGFLKFLKKLQEYNQKHRIADKIYVSIPELVHNYPLIDFDYQQQQYDATMDWVRKIPEDLAISLDDYITRNE